MGRCFALVLWCALCATSQAQDGSREPLRPDEVLASSAEHFPGILERLAQRRVAEGRVTEARGAFDLVFSADSFSRVDGFYDGTVVNGGARKPLRPLGASIYSKYSVSDGSFPVYEDQYFTNNGGDLKVGVLFSLLRDRNIDSRRFAETDSELALRQADLELLLTRVGVQQRALAAYWQWVATGQQLGVYRSLLDIAEKRERALETEVRTGRRAEIFLTENRQNITRRQTLVTQAQRDFRVAANRLALYYRDDQGQPLVPDAERLPAAGVSTPVPESPETQEMDVGAILAKRPELNILNTAMQRASRKVELSENDLLPRLDLNFELAEPFGSIGEGGVSRDTRDAIVGFTFSVPLEQRGARGRLSQAQSQLQALEQERRQLEDRIEVELRNILLELNVARRLMQLAALEVEQSDTMRRAEQRRFEQGASDFFLVNVREETAADARVRYYDAYRATQLARAEFHAATVNLARLGIAE
ncbi:MAG: TolC family protein [Chromatocurvus sp.]